VRRVHAGDDARTAAALLDRFNREYDVPTPGPEFLAERLEQLDGEQFAVFLARDAEVDAGVGVVRFRPALWAAAPEAYIAELYVTAEHRRRGLGGELLDAMLALARELGCAWIELGTDEFDADAHRLYERSGFSNLTDPAAPDGERERMFVYEREL
jgi:GNAT superfamily N-acetyltransferase